jgi:hypothetical protein
VPPTSSSTPKMSTTTKTCMDHTRPNISTRREHPARASRTLPRSRSPQAARDPVSIKDDGRLWRSLQATQRSHPLISSHLSFLVVFG